MGFSLLDFFDLIGTIAFALSGSAVAVRKGMDIFGVNVLAVTTACGGGLIRDLIIGNTPPNMFKNPFYVMIAMICATLFFAAAYQRQQMNDKVSLVYDKLLFWFDTVGLAAFAVDGVTIGADAGYYDNAFLLIFLGFMTGVGGGALRDIMANQMPDIFVKHIYALAAIAGAAMMVFTFDIYGDKRLAMVFGFAIVVVVRFMAERFKWNLPKVGEDVSL